MDIVERLRKAQQNFYGDTSINELHMYAANEIERLREDKNIYAETIYELEKDVRVKNDQIERLRKIIVEHELWKEAPCCLCGYNGPNYFQPSIHKCAALQQKDSE